MVLYPLGSGNVSESGVCAAGGIAEPGVTCTEGDGKCVSGFRCNSIDPTMEPPSYCLSHAQRIDYAGAGAKRYAYYAVKVKMGATPLYTSTTVTTPNNCGKLGLYTTIVGGDCAAEGPTLSSFSCAAAPATIAGAEAAPPTPPGPPTAPSGPAPVAPCPEQCVAQCASAGGVQDCNCASGIPVVTCHPAGAESVSDETDGDDDDGGLSGGAVGGIVIGVLVYCICYLVLMFMGWRSLPEAEVEQASRRRRSRRISRRDSTARGSRRSSRMMSFD